MAIWVSISLIFLGIAAGVSTYVAIRKWKKNKHVIEKTVELSEIKPSSRDVPISAIASGNVCLPSEEEFGKLVTFTENIGQRYTTSQGERYNKSFGFNLNRNVLPFDHNRVKLRNPIDHCDYVNATWISRIVEDEPTYDQLIYSSYVPYDNINFIIGQDPLPATLQHHYSLIHENKVDIVINFKEEGTTKPLNVGKTYHLKDLTLTVHNKNKVLNNLIRTEISLFHTTAKGGQYKHHAILYEFTSWPSDKITSSEETQDLVSAIVLMRQEMKLDKGAIKVMVHDPQSGLRGSAAFLVLYHLLQKVDNSFTENNKIKSSVEKIDVFGTVNRLRNDRAGMIDNYATYKLLFLSLGYYGPNRCALNQLGPLKSSEKIY